ncbi:MAG TPA: hypothetical protein VN948_23495 [Terriglobales bacterium]|nr:hypothetical protein [Terriglobales bacterium]
MTTPIPLNLAFEDALTESLALKILKTIPTGYATQTIYNRGGYGYLRRTINGFNNAAKGTPFLVGTDLDRYECPSALINDWLTHPKHHNLLIRVAVKEAEAWVLADRDSFANFLGISVVRVPGDVEALPNPKAALIQLARRARKKQVRDDICPPPNSTSKVGPNYNARLGGFVSESWNPVVARLNSRSLDRAMNRLVAFRPQWAVPA